MIGMDVAASEFYKVLNLLSDLYSFFYKFILTQDGKYDLDFKNPDSNPSDWKTSAELGDLYKGFINDAPVISIEDPFDQVSYDFPL